MKVQGIWPCGSMTGVRHATSRYQDPCSLLAHLPVPVLRSNTARVSKKSIQPSDFQFADGEWAFWQASTNPTGGRRKVFPLPTTKTKKMYLTRFGSIAPGAWKKSQTPPLIPPFVRICLALSKFCPKHLATRADLFIVAATISAAKNCRHDTVGREPSHLRFEETPMYTLRQDNLRIHNDCRLAFFSTKFLSTDCSCFAIHRDPLCALLHLLDSKCLS